jgi:hypothetical protein
MSCSLRRSRRRFRATLLALGLIALTAALIAPSSALAAAPTITKMEPNFGPPSGGTVVTISGSELSSPTKVEFGGVEGTELTEVSATKLTVKSPAHAEGKVEVIVTTAEGSSSPAATDEFTYIAAHSFKEVFGMATQPSFNTAYGIAAQADGDLLVVNKTLSAVERFHRDGSASNFAATATNALSGFALGTATETQVAVDNSGEATADNIYVAQKKTTPELKVFDSEGNERAALTEYKAGANAEGSATAFSGGVCGVAVDPSGNLYVAEYGTPGQIHEYSPADAVPGVTDNIHNFSAEKPCGLAAGAGSSAGSLFVDQEAKKVFKYTGGVADYEVTSSNLGIFAVSVDPVTGHLYAGSYYVGAGNQYYVSELDASGGSPLELSRTRLPTPPNGLAVSGGGNVYVSRSGDTNIEVYAPVSVGLSLGHTGEGTLVAECEEGSGFEACAAPLSELPTGTEVKVTATPTGGSILGSLSGTGSAESCSGSPCSFEITETTTVSAVFNPPGSAMLTVAKGGNGEGTVESATGGIDCGPTCSGSFVAGETVTLSEEAQEPGSIFVAWSGNCTPISLTECEVEVKSGGSFVAAIFAAAPVLTEFSGEQGPCEFGGTKIEYAGSTEYVCNGKIGEDGEDGKNIVVGTATSGECPEGGITVEVEGEPSTKKAICNGEEGATGPTGPTGAEGEPGPQGNIGEEGIQGLIGPNGPQGAPGAPGSEGKQGGRGPAGRNGEVTCKVQQQKSGRKVKVTCTVKYKGGKASASALSWRLTRGHRTVRHGKTTALRLNHVLSRLDPGVYVLHVGRHAARIAIPATRRTTAASGASEAEADQMTGETQVRSDR